MKNNRIYSVDIARGLVMIIMALDHARDLFYIGTTDPTDMATTTPLLFFTRWITHLCAPSFVFLSGVSAWLSIQRHGGASAGRSFLISRGIWLILLEVTIICFGIWFDIHFRMLMLQVIAAIGASFILLSLIIKLPARTIAIIGFVLVFGHDLLDNVQFPDNKPINFILSLLFRPGLFTVTPNYSIFVGYPILPWFGIMCLGYASGKLFDSTPERRKKLFGKIGLAAVALFIVVRFINVYGDPAPWSTQKNALYSFLSFMNVSKYPPSLLYTLITLGILFLFLSFIEGRTSRFTRIVTVYGKVPLFYYLIHWYVLHILMFCVLYMQGFHTSDFQFGPFLLGRPKGVSGVSLPVLYIIWLSVVIALYPVCSWYGKYKASHGANKWLRYL